MVLEWLSPMIKNFSLRFSLFLVLMDSVLVVGAVLIATAARIFLPFGLPGTALQRLLPLPVYIIGIAVHYFIYASMNIHSPRLVVTLPRELQVTLSAAFIGWLMFLGALYLTYRDVSRLQIVYFFVAHVTLIVLSRVALRLAYQMRGQRRISIRNVLIIGENDIARVLHRLIEEHRYSGLRVAGGIGVAQAEADLEQIIATDEVNEVVIALERNADVDLPALVRRLQALPVNIRLVPQYTDLAFLQLQVEDFSGMPLLTLKEPVLSPYQRLTKRLFDLTITLLLLVPLLPLMALIALLVRLDSPGPVIFRQQRIGEGGLPFEMFKFRSMVKGAEFQQEQVRRYDDSGNPLYKHPDDPRVTRIGSILRVTSLDELPQLYNVLRGDMSLVGPRPEMPELVASYEPWQRKRFEVPQGITGWWQVNGRANKPMHLNTEDDLYYIRNYSIWLDLQILWRTLWVVLARRGAF